MISLSPKSKFEHKVGMPIPRLTIHPSSNSIASRSHICWRVSPLAPSLMSVSSFHDVKNLTTKDTKDSRWTRRVKSHSASAQYLRAYARHGNSANSPTGSRRAEGNSITVHGAPEVSLAPP